MNLSERKQLYKKAIQKWGLPAQLGMLMEECAELIKATHKVLRNNSRSAWLGLAEELADVEIMIEQIKTQTDSKYISVRVKKFKHEKLLRLKKLLEEKC
jgi:NTP pyrophosphatase (non-canonical NTP hydrolase)